MPRTIDQAISAAIKHGNAGKMKDMEQVCRQALSTTPDSPILLNLLGTAAMAMGRSAEALNVFDRAISLRSDYAEAYSNRGIAFRRLGNLERAAHSFECAIRLKSDFAAALGNYGHTLHLLGRHHASLKAFDKAVELKPGNADLYHARATVHKDLDQPEAAVQDCNKAIRLRPDFFHAINTLGILRKQAGLLTAAVEHFKHAIETNPEYAEAYSNLGNTLCLLGRFEEAVEHHGKAARLKPDVAQIHDNLGNALRAAGRFQAAEKSYKRAVSCNPGFATAHNNRGAVLQALGRDRESIQAYDTAIQVKPDYAEAYNNRGNVLNKLGLFQEAIASYGAAVRIDPSYAEAYNNLGVGYKSIGEREKAEESFKKALRLRPEFAEVHRNLSTIKRFRPGDPQVDTMMKLIRDDTLSENARMHLSFALGKACHDVGDFKNAFKYVESGNQIRKKNLNYTIATDQALFSHIKTLFSKIIPEAIDTENAPLSGTPVFVLGMPRSGTSLIEQILASHSQVHGAGELELLNGMAADLLGGVSAGRLRAVRKAYRSGMEILGAGEPFITDKMPHNFRWIGWITMALPEAKIIHVKRSAPATCWSNFRHFFTEEGNGYACDLEDVAEYFLLYTDLMAFWQQKFPGKIYELDYETFTENQEDETRKLLRFSGLAWEKACLSFHETLRVVKTASALQVREKLYRGSSLDWRSYGDYLNPMMTILGDAACPGN